MFFFVTATLDAIYGGNEILHTNEEDQELDESNQVQVNEPIDRSNNDENNNTNNLSNDNESEDEEDMMDNEETHTDHSELFQHSDYSSRAKTRSHEEESEEEENEEEQQEDEERDEQETNSSDDNEDDDEASAGTNPGPSHSQTSRQESNFKEIDSKRSQQPPSRTDETQDRMNTEVDEDDDDPRTVISNSEKWRTKKSKRIDFQKRQDDSDNDVDDRIEDKVHSSKQTSEKANTSASFVLVNEFKSSTFTPESSMLPIIDQLTAAPKSKKKITKLPPDGFEGFTFKKSLQMNHEPRTAEDEDDDDEHEVNESDLMSTTIDTTKNDTIPFLNQSQMSINKSIQSGAQLNINNNRHLSFNQTSASIHEQLMDSVDEDL